MLVPKFVHARTLAAVVALGAFAVTSLSEAKLIVISRPVDGVPGPANHLLISARDDRTLTIVNRSLLGSQSGGLTSLGPNEADRTAIAAVWAWVDRVRPTPGYATAEVPKPNSIDSSTWELAVVTMFDNLYRCHYQDRYPVGGLGMNSNSIVDETIRKAGLEFRTIADLPQFSFAYYQKEWRNHRDPDFRYSPCIVSVGHGDRGPVTTTGRTPMIVSYTPPWSSPYRNDFIADAPFDPGCVGTWTLAYRYDFEHGYDTGHVWRSDTGMAEIVTGVGSRSVDVVGTTHWAIFTDYSVTRAGFTDITATCY